MTQAEIRSAFTEAYNAVPDKRVLEKVAAALQDGKTDAAATATSEGGMTNGAN